MTEEPLATKQTWRTFVQGIAVTAGAGMLAPATRSTWAAQPIGANNDLRMTAIRETLQGDHDALETLGRFERHLQAHAIELKK